MRIERPIQFGLWTGLVGAVVLIAHLPALLHPLIDGDEAIYGSIAALMNFGQPLYAAGGVDNKPPGIFWLYAATFHFFGNYQMTAVHAVGLLAVGVTCILLFKIASGLAGLRAGLLSALFYGLMTATGSPQLLASNTEVFMAVPLTGSVLLLLGRRWFWSGALLVAACTFRQTAAANQLLIPFAVAWLEQGSRRWSAAGQYAVGMLAALAALLALTLLTGSVSGLWRWAIETLYGYASGNWSTGLAFSRAQDSLLPFIANAWLLWIAALVLLVRWKALSGRERLILAWLASGTAGSVAGSHLSWHYFIQAMAPLAVVAALVTDRIRPKPRLALAGATALALPAATWLGYVASAGPLAQPIVPPFAEHAAVSSYIQSHTTSSDRVFVWGDSPDLYVESNRVMSTRFPAFLRGFARGSTLPPQNWDTAPDVWPLLESDLNSHPPALIVDTAPAGWSNFSMYPVSGFPVLAQKIALEYHVAATVDRVVIYARNGS